jgi:hypothetical protein
MNGFRHQRLSETLELISDLVEGVDLILGEELKLTRRDVISRIERRIRERGTPMTRDVLRSRRERKARSRYHAQKNVIAPPRKVLSTRLRTR